MTLVATIRHAIRSVLSHLSCAIPVFVALLTTLLAPVFAQAQSCDDGVVRDDGTAETAYGWVPSVVDGRFVQRFERSALPSPRLETVCLCWARTRADDAIDFDVEVYADAGGVPAAEPVARIPASAAAVPMWNDAGWYQVDLRAAAVTAPSEIFYVGARWDASADRFFFLCADHSGLTPYTEVFFIDELADEWTSTGETIDPMFAEHRALMVRLRAAAPAIPDLALPGVALALLTVAGSGVLLIRRA